MTHELNWTNNLLILSSTKTEEEREFYLRLCIRERYSKRVSERQINSALFERVMLVAAYETQLIDRELLRKKLHEFCEISRLLEDIDIPKSCLKDDLLI